MRVICKIYERNNKAKAKIKGTSLDGLLATIVLSNCLADIISLEKSITKEEAIDFICTSIRDTYKSIN